MCERTHSGRTLSLSMLSSSSFGISLSLFVCEGSTVYGFKVGIVEEKPAPAIYYYI